MGWPCKRVGPIGPSENGRVGYVGVGRQVTNNYEIYFSQIQLRDPLLPHGENSHGETVITSRHRLAAGELRAITGDIRFG
jgi:hypothetical protein